MKDIFKNISSNNQLKIYQILNNSFPLSTSINDPSYPSLEYLKDIKLNKYLKELNLPQEFENKSNEAILEFFEEKNIYGEDEVFRVRVMVVGPGEAGKTTLIHKLITNSFKEREFGMTDGVEMKEWKLYCSNNEENIETKEQQQEENNENNKNIDISFWDFGGQEIYLNTHPILFYGKTLYLLMWSPRQEKSVPVGYIRILENYCVNIRSIAPDAPIIIITSNSADCHPQIAILDELKKYIYLHHFEVDSKTGEGIEELKEGMKELILNSNDLSFARQLIPRSYNLLELKLKELKELNSNDKRFSISQEEFHNLYLSILRSNENLVIDSEITLSRERSKIVMELFHQWGVIFILPDNGYIILNPKELSNVFREVITCHSDAIRGKEVFEGGILVHNKIEEVWKDYDSELHNQFLSLLHKSELSYEIFNFEGIKKEKSLIPCLLKENVSFKSVTFKFEKEFEIRNTIKDTYQDLMPNDHSIWEHNLVGCINISFKVLLSNLFPKLMVRLHSITVPDSSFRNSFVVGIHEWNPTIKSMVKSICCIIEMKESQSILLIPYGSSYEATAISIRTIRLLLEDSFIGIDIKSLTIDLLIDERRYGRKEMSYSFENIDSSNFDKFGLISSYPGGISIKFLTPLFPELDWWNNLYISPYLNLSLSTKDRNNLSHLYYQYIQFNKTNNISDKILLSVYLQRVTPIFREHCLNISREPNILWLIAQSTNTPRKYYCIGVSPHPDPNNNWEIVWESKYTFNISESLLSLRNEQLKKFSPQKSLWKLIKKCLICLFGNSLKSIQENLEDTSTNVEWLGYLLELTSITNNFESILGNNENKYFAVAKNPFEENVYYTKNIDGIKNLDEIKTRIKIPIYEKIELNLKVVHDLMYKYKKIKDSKIDNSFHDEKLMIENEIKSILLNMKLGNISQNNNIAWIVYDETNDKILETNSIKIDFIDQYKDLREVLGLLIDRIDQSKDMKTLSRLVKTLKPEIEEYELKEFDEFKERLNNIDTKNSSNFIKSKEELQILVKDILDFINYSIDNFSTLIIKPINIIESIKKRVGDIIQLKEYSSLIDNLENIQRKINSISLSPDYDNESHEDLPLLFLIYQEDNPTNDPNRYYSINFLCNVCGNTPENEEETDRELVKPFNNLKIEDDVEMKQDSNQFNENKNIQKDEENIYNKTSLNPFSYLLTIPHNNSNNCWLNNFSKGMELTLNILEKKGKVGNISLDYLVRSLKYLKEMKDMKQNNNNTEEEELELINIETLNYLCEVFDEILKEETGNDYLSDLVFSTNSSHTTQNIPQNLCVDFDINSSNLLAKHELLVRLLFVLLNDDKGKKCGLKRIENEKCSWICGRKECREKYEVEGDDCLLFHF